MSGYRAVSYATIFAFFPLVVPDPTCRRQIFVPSEYTLQVVGLAGFIVWPRKLEVVL